MQKYKQWTPSRPSNSYGVISLAVSWCPFPPTRPNTKLKGINYDLWKCHFSLGEIFGQNVIYWSRGEYNSTISNIYTYIYICASKREYLYIVQHHMGIIRWKWCVGYGWILSLCTLDTRQPLSTIRGAPLPLITFRATSLANLCEMAYLGQRSKARENVRRAFCLYYSGIFVFNGPLITRFVGQRWPKSGKYHLNFKLITSSSTGWWRKQNDRRVCHVLTITFSFAKWKIGAVKMGSYPSIKPIFNGEEMRK